MSEIGGHVYLIKRELTKQRLEGSRRVNFRISEGNQAEGRVRSKALGQGPSLTLILGVTAFPVDLFSTSRPWPRAFSQLPRPLHRLKPLPLGFRYKLFLTASRSNDTGQPWLGRLGVLGLLSRVSFLAVHLGVPPFSLLFLLSWASESQFLHLWTLPSITTSPAPPGAIFWRSALLSWRPWAGMFITDVRRTGSPGQYTVAISLLESVSSKERN